MCTFSFLCPRQRKLASTASQRNAAKPATPLGSPRVALHQPWIRLRTIQSKGGLTFDISIELALKCLSLRLGRTALTMRSSCSQGPLKTFRQFARWVTRGRFLDVGVKFHIEPNGGIFDVSAKTTARDM